MNIMLALIIGIVIGYVIKGCESSEKYGNGAVNGGQMI